MPRTITCKQVEHFVVKTLGAATGGRHPLSTRSGAQAAVMSQTAGQPDLAGVRPQPHLVETWKPPTDPQFIDKVRDIVGL